MKNKNIRLALVGYGMPVDAGGTWRGGSLFNLAVKQIGGIVPAAVCDTNRECLKNARKDVPGCKLYTDFDKMIKSVPIDALIVGTPAPHHTEFAVKALRRNIHVLSEIPSVWSMAEAEQWWQAHLSSKAMYMTGSNANYAGFWDTAVDLKQRGLFGDPIYVEAEYLHDGDGRTGLSKTTPWRATLEPIRYCTHSLGPILRLIEGDLEWVSCFDTGSHINKFKGQHDAMAALFRTKSNVVVRLLVSFVNNYLSGGRGGHGYRFFTTKGCFERPHLDQRTLFYSKELPVNKGWIELPVAAMPPKYASNPNAIGHGGVDYAMLDAFFNAIREGAPSPLSLKEGLRMTLPGVYAAESARNGGKLLKIRYPWSENGNKRES